MASSLIDRLSAEDAAALGSRGPSLRDLKQALRRDLENLLNTRWRCKTWPPELDDFLDSSVVSYGIPDFTGANLANTRDMEEFRRMLERSIRLFEPRLRNATVTMVDARGKDRRLVFRIDAKVALERDAALEDATFQTALDTANAMFTVQKADR